MSNQTAKNKTKEFFKEKAVKSMGISVVAHVIILIIIYIAMLPAAGSEGDDFIEISFESSQNSDSTAENTENNNEEYQPDLLENIDDLENEVEKFTDDGYSEQEYIEQQYKKLQQQEQDAKESGSKIGNNIKKRTKYGPLTPRMFYGVRVYARNVIFVLDISGSMNISEAKLQLKNAYHSLKGGENFNIVLYSDNGRRWKNAVVLASDKNKSDADNWMNRMGRGGGTNMYDGLRLAFETARAEKDTIIFLTDGHPNQGLIRNPSGILQQVATWNKNKNITIHTIGIGSHQAEVFLETLAAENNGIYHKR